MDYKLTRSINIVLGAVSTGLEAYAFGASLVNRAFEYAVLSITSFYTVEAVVMLILYSKEPKKTWELAWRIIACFLLLGSGAALMWSTIDIENSSELGQEFEMKLAAASIAIVNAIFYVLAKPKAPPKPMPVPVHNYTPEPENFARGYGGYPEGQRGYQGGYRGYQEDQQAYQDDYRGYPVGQNGYQHQDEPEYPSRYSPDIEDPLPELPLTQGVFIVPRARLATGQVGPAPAPLNFSPYPVDPPLVRQPSYYPQLPPQTGPTWTR